MLGENIVIRRKGALGGPRFGTTIWTWDMGLISTIAVMCNDVINERVVMWCICGASVYVYGM